MGLGIVLKKLNKKQINIIIVSSFVIFISMALILFFISGGFKKTSTMKYPPRIYYLSYAVGMSLVLYKISQLKFIDKFFNNSLVRFVSKSSMWIYLWHILYLFILEWYFAENFNWAVNFILIYTLAVITTYIQNKFIDKINASSKYSYFIKYLRG